MSELPSLFSVVIPTFGRDDCLVQCLSSLLLQDDPTYEIIVIDQNPKPFEKVLTFLQHLSELDRKKIRYYLSSHRGRSIAKNYGISEAHGAFVLFCDDDIIAPKNLISTHRRYHQDVHLGGVSCRVWESDQPDNELTSQVLRITCTGRIINHAYSRWSGPVETLNGGNMSMKKVDLQRIGFFEEALEGTSLMEEPDLSFRLKALGKQLLFDGSVTVLHFPQLNGNLHSRDQVPYSHYHGYFHNLGFYFAKNGLWWRTGSSFLYTVAHAVYRGSLLYRNPKWSVSWICSYLRGAAKGRHYRRISADPLFTPRRTTATSLKRLQ